MSNIHTAGHKYEYSTQSAVIG